MPHNTCFAACSPFGLVFAWKLCGKRIRLASLCLLVALSAHAQYVFRHYTTADGLPSSNVYHCLQDSAGFMWFATDKGMCRFDGSDFADTDMDGYEGKSLTTISLAIDKNHLLAGTYGGFMSVDNPWRAWKIGVGPSDIDYEYYRIAYAGGFLYYRTYDNHLAAYDMKRRRQFHVANQDMDLPFCMTKTIDGRVYYAQKGLYMIKGLITSKCHVPALNTKEINHLSADAHNELWASSRQIVYHLKDDVVVDSIKCSFYKGNPLFVYNSRIFGPVIYDQYGNGNPAYHELSALLTQGVGCIITSLFEDRYGNLWVNTSNKGSYCVLHSYISMFSGKGGVYEASVQGISVGKPGEVYLATSFGMVYKQGNTFRPFGRTHPYFCYSVCKTGDKILATVAASDSNKLHKISDPSIGKTYYQAGVRRMCLMNDSEVVFNAWRNRVYLATLDFKSGMLKIKKGIEFDSVAGHCQVIFKKDRSHVLVATTDGCYLMDLDKGKSERIETIKSTVNDVIADISGTIYLASEAGLYIMKQAHANLIRDVKGIQLRHLSSLAIDRKGRLWIGSDNGLLAWKGEFLKRISGSARLPSPEINRLFYEAESNQLYIGTNSGLSVLDVSRMDSLSVRKPDLMVWKVQSRDRLYNPAEDIRLNAGVDGVDIYFSVLELADPQDLYFRYTLNDAPGWTITNDKVISLRGLAYGKHRVLIQASANGVDWGKPGEVNLHVGAPFYMSFRFWLPLLCLVAILIAVSIKIRIRSIQKKAEERMRLQQKLEELRYQALNAAVGQHFIFNTLGAIQSFVMNSDPFHASDYIAKFARLIRITLSYAGEKYISINEEINRLTLYLELEKLRCGDKLHYTIDVRPSVDRFMSIPNMIIQPLLENAVQHGILPLDEGVPGYLEVSIDQHEDRLLVRVRDNGVGISGRQQSKHGYHSIGLANLRERLEMIKDSQLIIRNLQEIDSREHGTMVEIILPLNADQSNQ